MTTHTIHPVIAAAKDSLPLSVKLRNGSEAILDRIERETKFRYGLPLVGRLRLTDKSLPLEDQGKYHLWTATGHFATDNRDHQLDIVALINPDRSLTPLEKETA